MSREEQFMRQVDSVTDVKIEDSERHGAEVLACANTDPKEETSANRRAIIEARLGAIEG